MKGLGNVCYYGLREIWRTFCLAICSFLLVLLFASEGNPHFSVKIHSKSNSLHSRTELRLEYSSCIVFRPLSVPIEDFLVSKRFFFLSQVFLAAGCRLLYRQFCTFWLYIFLRSIFCNLFSSTFGGVEIRHDHEIHFGNFCASPVPRICYFR